VDPGNRSSSKMRFFGGCVLRFELSVEFLAHGKWEASNPWHTATSQLIKLSHVVFYDEVFIESSGDTVVLHLVVMMTAMMTGRIMV
jgi:hypothetical protein